MQTNEPPRTIQTARLTLRPVADGDFDAVHAYAIDPEVYRYMLWGPNTPEITREVLDRWQADDARPWPRADLNYGVERRGEAGLIGVVSLHHADTDAGAVGYCLARVHWGRGYALEAAEAVVDVAFQVLQHRRVWATCDARNVGSWRVMEKLGMTREGRLRQDVRAHDGWRDSFIYGLLAAEWRALKNNTRI